MRTLGEAGLADNYDLSQLGKTAVGRMMETQIVLEIGTVTQHRGAVRVR